MDVEQIEAKHVKKGKYILIDDSPSIVSDNATSAPGKHGHAKCRITATGIIDGKKRVIMRPGDGKVPSPVVDTRNGQIVSIDGDRAQLMDAETYEMFDTKIPDNLKAKAKEGVMVDYWLIGGEIRIIVDVKEE